jgi:hypothetical protein
MIRTSGKHPTCLNPPQRIEQSVRHSILQEMIKLREMRGVRKNQGFPCWPILARCGRHEVRSRASGAAIVTDGSNIIISCSGKPLRLSARPCTTHAGAPAPLLVRFDVSACSGVDHRLMIHLLAISAFGARSLDASLLAQTLDWSRRCRSVQAAPWVAVWTG